MIGIDEILVIYFVLFLIVATETDAWAFAGSNGFRLGLLLLGFLRSAES